LVVIPLGRNPVVEYAPSGCVSAEALARSEAAEVPAEVRRENPALALAAFSASSEGPAEEALM